MYEKTAFINIDFLPPAAERLCMLPEAAEISGYDNVILRMIDNFPWSFDCRMKSDTAYDETALSYISKKFNELGIGLIFVFPGINDFSRLFRLKGYRRFADVEHGSVTAKTEAFGFSAFLESVAEDFNFSL